MRSIFPSFTPLFWIRCLVSQKMTENTRWYFTPPLTNFQIKKMNFIRFSFAFTSEIERILNWFLLSASASSRSIFSLFLFPFFSQKFLILVFKKRKTTKSKIRSLSWYQLALPYAMCGVTLLKAPNSPWFSPLFNFRYFFLPEIEVISVK